MSRQGTFERELLQVWKALQEVSPAEARGFSEHVELFAGGLRVASFELEEYRVRGRSLAQRHGALAARGIIERLVRELSSVGLHIEAIKAATPAPAKPARGASNEAAKSEATAKASATTTLSTRAVLDAEFDEAPRPGPRAGPMPRSQRQREVNQLTLGALDMAPGLRGLPSRGGSGQ